MNRLLLSLLSIVAVLSARADNYEGTITQDAFQGYYTYTSDTVDGTFWAAAPFWAPTLLPPNSNDTLQGLIDLEWAPYPDANFNGYIPDAPNLLTSTINDGELTVTNGAVTGFNWTWAEGNFYAFYGLNGWDTQINDESVDPNQWYYDAGGMVFGAPVDLSTQVNTVPESGTTLLLLGAGVLLCLVLRRRGFPLALVSDTPTILL